MTWHKKTNRRLKQLGISKKEIAKRMGVHLAGFYCFMSNQHRKKFDQVLDEILKEKEIQL